MPADLGGKTNGMETSTLPRTPLDLERLTAQTGGDAALEREVLALFADRVLADLERLKAAGSGGERNDVAHLIVGAALAVGADEVARLAREIESGGGSIAALAASVSRVRQYISLYLASGE